MLYEDLSTVLSKIKLATTCSDAHYQGRVVVASPSLGTPTICAGVQRGTALI